ncbi:MAG: hypothetical protein RSA65_09545, partial [Clostridia bacterium]
MRLLRTFGELLSELMEKHALTIAALAAALALPNTNTVSRLLRDETSEKRRTDFVANARMHPELFSPAEIEQLETAIIVSRLGKESYKAQKSIYNLIFDTPVEALPYHLPEAGCTLQEYFSRFSKREPLQILCFNCCERDIFAALKPLFDESDRIIEMNHYISVNEDSRNYALLIQTVSPLLMDHRYRLYTTTDRDNATDALFFMPYAMLLKVGIGVGATETLLLFHSDRTVRILYNMQRVSSYSNTQRMIAGIQPPPRPLYATKSGASMHSYRDFLFSCYQRERNRSIYQIRLDPCFEMIPPEIVVRAFDTTVLSGEIMNPHSVESLIAILQSRYHNLFQKTKPTYLMLSLAATERFAHSGVMSDHFFGLRPFAREDVIAILDSLLLAARNNPRFHLHFLLDGLQMREYQFVGIEQQSVLLCKSDTHYDLDNSYQEIVVDEPAFLKQ